MIIVGTPLPREPAVYRTAPWQTQTAIGGDCQTADSGAKPDRSRNAADPYPVEIGGNSLHILYTVNTAPLQQKYFYHSCSSDIFTILPFIFNYL